MLHVVVESWRVGEFRIAYQIPGRDLMTAFGSGAWKERFPLLKQEVVGQFYAAKVHAYYISNPCQR